MPKQHIILYEKSAACILQQEKEEKCKVSRQGKLLIFDSLGELVSVRVSSTGLPNRYIAEQELWSHVHNW